jgi:DNA-directed RNA polymerase specialized sigma24 family protein
MAKQVYSHLGSSGDAEDVVLDAWLRLERANRGEQSREGRVREALAHGASEAPGQRRT